MVSLFCTAALESLCICPPSTSSYATLAHATHTHPITATALFIVRPRPSTSSSRLALSSVILTLPRHLCRWARLHTRNTLRSRSLGLVLCHLQPRRCFARLRFSRQHCLHLVPLDPAYSKSAPLCGIIAIAVFSETAQDVSRLLYPVPRKSLQAPGLGRPHVRMLPRA